ncbi:hypothetical protein evm_014587 [Chilo suppressalis]|nr:hypothetical protein evm_014587 [Chilo suppressalis]
MGDWVSQQTELQMKAFNEVAQKDSNAAHLALEKTILNKNPLIYLKELRIMQSDFLTMVSAETIIRSCLSLEILVELESWNLLSDSDRDHIKNHIKINNLNIDISPIRRYDV